MPSGADDKQSSTDLARRLDDGVEALEVTLPAIPTSIGHLRSYAREFAAGAGATDAAVTDIALAISEAATNAVIHAYPAGKATNATASLRGNVADDWLELAVGDRGAGFRPGPAGGLGFGLKVMAQVSDSMRVEQRDEGTTVVLRFALAR
jgi:serine/threonine-protein kinase RsbW/stage II sporulation protein AB (anti-sigma F factor)